MRDMNSTSEHHPWKHREMINGALIQLFKFWENGRPAFLNINTHGGQAWINFSGSLGFHSEHEQSRKFSTFQTKSSKSKTSQSPSKIKRNRIRAEAFRERKRREANNFSEKTNSSTQLQSATSSNLVADVSDIENPNELNKNSPSDIFHEQILETHDQQEKSTSTQQIEEATISSERNSTEVTFNSPLADAVFNSLVIDEHSNRLGNSEQNSSHKSSENLTPAVEQDSSTEEMPKKLENNTYTETEFTFWETKVEEAIEIWGTILDELESEEEEDEKFISLQVQFLRKIREEMGDSNLFDEWLIWHKKKYPKRPFSETALCRL